MGKRNEERLEKRKEMELGAFSGRVASNESWGFGDLQRWALKRENGHERECARQKSENLLVFQNTHFSYLSLSLLPAFLDLYCNQRVGMCMYILGEMGTGKTG